MKRTTYYCDLCELQKVNPEDRGMFFLLNSGSHQKWPVASGSDIKICNICCKLLVKARQFQLITINTEPLFIRHGWNKDKDGNWSKG